MPKLTFWVTVFMPQLIRKCVWIWCLGSCQRPSMHLSTPQPLGTFCKAFKALSQQSSKAIAAMRADMSTLAAFINGVEDQLKSKQLTMTGDVAKAWESARGGSPSIRSMGVALRGLAFHFLAQGVEANIQSMIFPSGWLESMGENATAASVQRILANTSSRDTAVGIARATANS